MKNSTKLARRIGGWLGLSGDYRPRPGETRPLWYKVPKSRYLAISVLVILAAIALYIVFLCEGMNWSFASVFAVQSLALVMLVLECASVKFHDEDAAMGARL